MKKGHTDGGRCERREGRETGPEREGGGRRGERRRMWGYKYLPKVKTVQMGVGTVKLVMTAQASTFLKLGGGQTRETHAHKQTHTHTPAIQARTHIHRTKRHGERGQEAAGGWGEER